MNSSQEERPVFQHPPAGLIERELKLLKKKAETRRMIVGVSGTLLCIAAACVLLAIFLFPFVRVTMNSMYPTLHNGELIIFTTAGEIGKGDVIAFRDKNKTMIKRVIAVPGEKVEVNTNGRVLINGNIIDEPYVNEYSLGNTTMEMPILLPPGRIFVIGDNRAVSIDSRSYLIGTIDIENQVIGRALLRVWPLTRIGLIH